MKTNKKKHQNLQDAVNAVVKREICSYKHFQWKTKKMSSQQPNLTTLAGKERN